MRIQKMLWRFCCVGVIVLSVLAFTPLTIPKDTFLPEFLGLPYTLWVGMLLSLGFTVLIFIGISVHADVTQKENKR